MKILFKASLGSWPRVMALIGPIFITEKERERESLISFLDRTTHLFVIGLGSLT